MLRRFFAMPVIFLLIMALSYQSSAQLSTADSGYLSSSIENAIQTFRSTLKENAHLFNGWQNTNYEQRSSGHPYFLEDSMQLGSVLYDGTLYKNIPLLYDESNDNLLTVQYYTPGRYLPEYAVQKKPRMDLVKEKTIHFTIAGHEFVRPDSLAATMPSGFYERAYSGTVKMYIKRSKKYIEEVKQKDVEIRYETFDDYYIFNNKQFYHIKSKKSLVDAFEGKEQQVRNFINSMKEKFRKNREKAIFETTEYYDKLVTAGL